MIAASGAPLKYGNGTISTEVFHESPDDEATFPDTNPEDGDGWIYVSNSELLERGTGGVSVIVFDKNGTVIEYKSLLKNTTMNVVENGL
jgi:hypothetical protein